MPTTAAKVPAAAGAAMQAATVEVASTRSAAVKPTAAAWVPAATSTRVPTATMRPMPPMGTCRETRGAGESACSQQEHDLGEGGASHVIPPLP